MSFFRRKKKQRGYTSEIHKSMVQKIKGYVSYETPEERLKTDQAFREFLYLQLLNISDLFSRIKGYLLQLQILSTWHASEQISKQLQEMKWLLTAPKEEVYRHSTFFDSPKVKEWIDINVLYIIESEMILVSEDIKKHMRTVLERFEGEETALIEKEIMIIHKNVNELATSLKERAELLASFEIMALE